LVNSYIREENLLQTVLWKTVHFAPFLVENSKKISPGLTAGISFSSAGISFSSAVEFNFSAKF